MSNAIVQEAIRTRLASKRTELQDTIQRGGPDATDAQERLDALQASGQLPAGEDRFLAIATRENKTVTTQQDLDRHWRQTAEHAGVTHVQLTEMQQPGYPVVPARRERIHARLTEHDAMISRSHTRAIALEEAAGEPIHQALTHLAQLRDQDELLELDDKSWTTRTHRDQELATQAVAIDLAAGDLEPIPPQLIDHHRDRLDQELQTHGGRLSDEQQAALTLACGEGQLVVIEGQAGTGKSTVLIGIARAHEDAGQRIVVTSTAALAARRLADDLTTAGTHPAAYSTVGLAQAIDGGLLTLDPSVTVIHDEAALASTRELHRLLHDIDESGARLILVGDPRQSHPVGAGGMWPTIHAASKDQGMYASLTTNLRAQDPEDAHAQQLFRDQEHLCALRNYADRGRVHLDPEQQDSEDRALDAAQADREAERRTLVVAQTSNDHLDELNARAQAIRIQRGELAPAALPLPGRPYGLHPRDEVQLRSSIAHPEHGVLRNGTTATIARVDPEQRTAELHLADGRAVQLDQEEAERADLRLAYVQHPFLAQGTTSDTTHVIVAEHPNREGTYVALTRARDQTHIYAATSVTDAAQEALPQLAKTVSATEPDLPSIAQPLARDSPVTQMPGGDLRLHPAAIPSGRASTQIPTPRSATTPSAPTGSATASPATNPAPLAPNPRPGPSGSAWLDAPPHGTRWRHTSTPTTRTCASSCATLPRASASRPRRRSNQTDERAHRTALIHGINQPDTLAVER